VSVVGGVSGVERVLIVGGGIAGLATAAGLRQAGIACEIVEQTEAWAPVGAGIVVSVNAMSVMRRLGVDELIAERGASLGRGGITDHRGRPLAMNDFADLHEEFGPTIAIHRAALHDVLLTAAGDTPISLGTSVDRLAQHPEHVDVRLTDGREERFDLVIGADGLRSRVRTLLFGDVPLQYSGYACWRLVVKAPVAVPDMCEMWGSGTRFGVAPIDAERVYCFAVANAPRGELDPAVGRVERFRTRFAEFGGQVPDILRTVERPEELIHNDLEELPVVPWFSSRVVLVGDAAHAMTPNMGQGAAMALEDSAVLVELLRGGGPIAETLDAFAARRQSRVRWIVDQSRRIGRIGQLENPALRWLRNTVVHIVPDRSTTNALIKLARQPL
jgi:2-polyprenyl-6-methoxyphenol hydroxylase-like FAD-dependent oxidoreductase